MTSPDSYKDFEVTDQSQVSDCDIKTGVSHGLRQNNSNDQLLPMSNHIHGNVENRSDITTERNFQLPSSRHISNRTLSNNSGAFNQGNKILPH